LGTSLTDVADPEQVDRLFEEALHGPGGLGGLDVLVNNAGIAGPTAAVEDCDIEGWRRTLAVNLDATFYCSRRAIPALKAAGGGAIVNMSSSAGLFGYALRSPYVAAKWAIIGFTKTLAMELGPRRPGRGPRRARAGGPRHLHPQCFHADFRRSGRHRQCGGFPLLAPGRKDLRTGLPRRRPHRKPV
jgi:hypothetical protein